MSAYIHKSRSLDQTIGLTAPVTANSVDELLSKNLSIVDTRMLLARNCLGHCELQMALPRVNPQQQFHAPSMWSETQQEFEHLILEGAMWPSCTENFL